MIMHEANYQKKDFYKHFFSEDDQVEKWCDLYNTADVAAFYGQKMRLKQSIEWTSEYESFKKDGIILDLGCGPGVAICTLEKLNYNYKIVGVDQALPMLKKAKTNTKSAKATIGFLQGDIETLPFKTSSIDVIFCLGVISYLKSGRNAVFEIARVLKPQGIVILSFHRRTNFLEYLFPLFRNMKCLFLRKSGKRNQFKRQKYSLDEIGKLFYQNRLKIVQTKVIDYSSLTLSWRKVISTHLALLLNRYLLNYSYKFPFNKLGDMYLIKAEN